MSQDETEKLVAHALDCSEGECSLEEVDQLIFMLQEQQHQLTERLDQVRSMVSSLEVLNADSKRENVDEIRETVRAIFRVFQLGDVASGNDYPSLSKPTGYSGEVGKGSQTAWDVLAPKKWKKSDASL